MNEERKNCPFSGEKCDPRNCELFSDFGECAINAAARSLTELENLSDVVDAINALNRTLVQIANKDFY